MKRLALLAITFVLLAAGIIVLLPPAILTFDGLDVLIVVIGVMWVTFLVNLLHK